MDLNRDRVVTRPEAVAHVASERFRNGETGLGTVVTRETAASIALGIVDELFNKADKDENDLVTLPEFLTVAGYEYGPIPLQI